MPLTDGSSSRSSSATDVARAPHRLGVAEHLARRTERVEQSEHEAPRHLVQVEYRARRAATDERRETLVADVVGESDVQLDAERPGDLVGEEASDRAAGRIAPSEQLALVPAERLAVVAVTVAGCPRRRLRGEHVTECVGVGQHLQRDRRVDHGEAGLVRHELADGDVALARLRELGPVRRDGGVDVEQPAGVGDRHRHRRQPLRGREDRHHRVLLPGERPRCVAMAAPQVDDRAPVEVHGARRADLVALTEVGPERVGHRAEAGVDVAVHRCRRPNSARPSGR